MEYRGKFLHTLVLIQHISIIIIIDICYTSCHLWTQTVSPTLTGFQGINNCIQYMYSCPHKPIFYTSNYYDGSNVTRLIWSGNQVEDCTTQNCLEFHQDVYHDIILNIRHFFRALIILFLEFWSSGKYIFNHL